MAFFRFRRSLTTAVHGKLNRASSFCMTHSKTRSNSSLITSPSKYPAAELLGAGITSSARDSKNSKSRTRFGDETHLPGVPTRHMPGSTTQCYSPKSVRTVGPRTPLAGATDCPLNPALIHLTSSASGFVIYLPQPHH